MPRPVLRRPIPMAVERAVVDALGLEEDRRIVILDRGDQQPLGVIGGRRDHRLEPRDMGERSEEHTSELQSLMRISYAVFCLKKKKKNNNTSTIHTKYPRDTPHDKW